MLSSGDISLQDIRSECVQCPEDEFFAGKVYKDTEGFHVPVMCRNGHGPWELLMPRSRFLEGHIALAASDPVYDELSLLLAMPYEPDRVLQFFVKVHELLQKGSAQAVPFFRVRQLYPRELADRLKMAQTNPKLNWALALEPLVRTVSDILLYYPAFYSGISLEDRADEVAELVIKNLPSESDARLLAYWLAPSGPGNEALEALLPGFLSYGTESVASEHALRTLLKELKVRGETDLVDTVIHEKWERYFGTPFE